MHHVVWDWNGTLFDDQHLVVDALNVVLADFDLPAVEMRLYQQLYTRPVQVFYSRLFGRPISGEEWERIDDLYHSAYHDLLEHAGLAADALAALDRVAAAGKTQSLLSMYRHEHLMPLVERLGVADYFCRIDGLRGEGGGRKATHLEVHAVKVAEQLHDTPSEILIVGDALDDAHAANYLGATCVLYDGGSHPVEELREAGVPVAHTLLEALDLGGV